MCVCVCVCGVCVCTQQVQLKDLPTANDPHCQFFVQQSRDLNEKSSQIIYAIIFVVRGEANMPA